MCATHLVPFSSVHQRWAISDVFSSGERNGVLAEYDRDWPVVATKGYFPMDDDNPNARGLSRKAIEQELRNSFDRLGMETVDLYQILRWDYDTPIEETLRALDDAVRRGQTRYIGASSMWTHQFADALHTSEQYSFERFVSMQNHYNLTYREEERDMIPFCEREGIGILLWSPLGRGYLTRPHETFLETARGEFMYETDRFRERIDTYQSNGGKEINERVEELAAEKGVSMAQIALSWLSHQDAVDAPLVGTTNIEHLEAAVEALDIDLSDSDLEYLEEPYEPVGVNGHEKADRRTYVEFRTRCIRPAGDEGWSS